jgi:serine/threonine-protein kinase
MSRAYILDGKPLQRQSETTTEYPVQGGKPSASRPPCKFARPGSSTGTIGHEIARVLRQRLLLAALITAGGFTVFFVRSLIAPPHIFQDNSLHLVVQGCAAATLVLIATILGSHLCLSLRQLRITEIVLFGVIAAFFAWMQINMFHGGRVLDWAKPGDLDAQTEVLHLANTGNLLRWFALIVIYGTFVPNTWKRCAMMVGIWAAIPIGLMFLMCWGCPVMGGYAPRFIGDLIILLSMASAVAVFGSWKISELRAEVLQARQLGQYRLKQLIGSGGMGEVYLGEHMLLRRACAIKLIRPDQTGDGTNLSRFEREVRAMATLTHWNTVEIYDYGHAEDGTFYYVMEYLPGLSLQELVDRYGPLSPERAIHFLRQVCDALQEAHSIGLIHRDIKPSNVLATERGGIYDVAKILDFGLVQSVGLTQQDVRLTIQGVVLGSPPYMSPEQAMGKSLDHRTDIYSLGGLAYFLLTGQPPFERDAPMQVLMAHVYEKVKAVSEIRPEAPADLEAVIMKCLNKEPADRYQDAESLEQALEHCDAANGWSRHDAADWWRQHQHSEKETPAAVA